MRKRVQDWRRWLTNCRHDGDCWQGRAFIPSWGETLDLRILVDEEGEPTSTQVRSLGELVRRRDDLRGRVQRRLFRYYKDEVREDVPASAAPPLRRSADLWPMLSEPEIWVDDRRSGPTFVLAFQCSWDREHGLGVRVHRWRVVDIGGAAEA